MGARAAEARGRVAALVLATAAIAFVPAGAEANNLDKRTMNGAAKQIAKSVCRDTSGCRDWRVRKLHRVSRHKAIGKIEMVRVKRGTKFDCVRQLVIKLDHDTGKVFYGLSRRNCERRARA